MTTYCAGFLLDDFGRVVLVRKNRPEWQAGRLNGVGGHVEPGETPLQAMRREFREEAGLDLDGWEHFATVTFPAGEVWFYRLFTDLDTLDKVSTKTDEAIEIHSSSEVAYLETLPNLSWLVPLAAYRHDRYVPLVAAEVPA